MIEKKRISELSAAEYSNDLYVAVDSELSGTGSLQMGDLISNIQRQMGETVIDVPDDPKLAGYRYMMTTKFASPATETQPSGEYVTIDIVTPNDITGTVTSIPLPYVLNLSSTQYSCSNISYLSTGTDFFGNIRRPDRTLSAGVYLTPVCLSCGSVTTTWLENKSIHIVSKLATVEEMGVTEIYNGNPFQDVMSQEAYAFGGKRIAIDFSSSNAAVIQLTLETQIPSEVNERQPLVLGFAVDDSFATADEIITGSDRAAADPSGTYRNLDVYNYAAARSYLSVLNYRSNRNGQDFAFPEDFQLPYYYGQSKLSASFYDYDYGNTFWSRINGSTYRQYAREIPRVFSQTLVLNPKSYQAYAQKYNTDGTLVRTYLSNFRSLRLIVGTGKNYHNTKTGVTTSMPPKFRITGCSLKIYK